ncbi:B3 DNA binding domain containing protein [Parasponia andersonii]|uniref:B3 DNA binding domain containing protein n=1 Tax=Parasponia andersonii TaxID=3476 RepID=A0A2P5BT45_PARAD|nr:B3 DNA binding domain containing protein [Parasponia andersonii]
MADYSEFSVNQVVYDDHAQSSAADNYDQLMMELASHLNHPLEGTSRTSSRPVIENQGRIRRHPRDARDSSNRPLVYQPPRTPRVPIVAPPSPPPRVINQLKMRFLFEKQLQNSDVGPAGRVVIPKKVAELHLPQLETKEGTWMHLDDMDFFQVWSVKFRYWPNNSSRMYVFENTKLFVSAYGLAVDDYIMVYKDDENESYVIRAKKSMVPVMDIPAAYNTLQNMNMNNIINQPAAVNEYDNWLPPIFNSQENNQLYGNPMEFHGRVRPAGFEQVDQYPNSDSVFVNF